MLTRTDIGHLALAAAIVMGCLALVFWMKKRRQEHRRIWGDHKSR